MHGEAANSNEEAAEKFAKVYKGFVKSEVYVLNQVFNCEWNRPVLQKYAKSNVHFKRRKIVPGHKPIKDCPILLLFGNACGDLKIKPLFV